MFGTVKNVTVYVIISISFSIGVGGLWWLWVIYMTYIFHNFLIDKIYDNLVLGFF